MKRATVSGTFGEVKGNCYATATGTGGTLRVAVTRALAALLRQPNIKGKRVTRFTCAFTVVDCVTDGERTAQHAE